MQPNRALKFDFENCEESSTFRTIHYLGSKLRALKFIKKTIDELDPSKKGVCDLFSGSGVVSHYLSQERTIISADIQNYSTVICGALLNPISDNFINNFIPNLKKNKIIDKELKKFSELINYEDQILNKDLNNTENVSHFLENCSIYNFIENKDKKISKELYKILSEAEKKLKNDSNKFIITKYYGGLFFSFKQSIILDIILNQINKLSKKYKNFLLASLLSTASDLVNTVGKQFAQPIRPKNKSNKPKIGLINQLKKDRNLDVFFQFEKCLNKYSKIKSKNKNHKIFRLDFKDTLEKIDEKTKIVYADPPYTRDHYSRFYHVLETISLSDSPVVSKTKIGGKLKNSRGMYREGRHQSDFCIKSKAPNAFEYLFNKVSKKNKILLLSYSPYDENKNSHPRVVALNVLKKIANKHFKFVEIKTIGKFTHNKLNKSSLHLKASQEAEILIICRN